MTTYVQETTLAARVVDGVDRIADADWRRLTRGLGLYSSPRWLRSLEDDPWHDVWYVVVDGPDGVPLGVLPAYLSTAPAAVAADSFYDPGTLFFAGSPAADRWQPTLLVGGRAGYETELIVDPDLSVAERAAVVDALFARVDRLAQAFGVDRRAALYLSADAAAELAPHFGTAPLLTDVSATLDLAGAGDFDGYLAGLSAHRRPRVRKELRDFAASGLNLRWTTLGEAAAALAPLLAVHHQRYGHADTVAHMRAHLDQQAAELDDLSRVLLCLDGEEVVGGLIAYVWDGVWYARIAAAGAGLRDRAFAFFSLVFYEPIRAALADGARGYVLGPSSIDSKLKRGAQVHPRWSLLQAPAPELATLNADWNRKQRRELGGYVIPAENYVMPQA